MKLYIAGSSDELDRAAHWHAQAREIPGVEVMSTWPDNITEVGEANPTDATDDQREAWAECCLAEVQTSDVLWLLMPQEGPGRGAFFELGVAVDQGLEIVVSGLDQHASIFTALAGESYACDTEAMEWIKGRAY